MGYNQLRGRESSVTYCYHTSLHRMNQSLARWLRVWRFRLKTFLGTRPALYFAVYRFRSGHDRLLVDAETDLCVEGFPRSANSFTVSAITAAQPEPINTADHTHVAANAMRACELGVPTLVLIRDPKDAVISLTALGYQTRGTSSEAAVGAPPIPFALQVEAWIAFYEALESFRGRYVIAPFEMVIQDIGSVVRGVNARFGTDFVPFEHTDENVVALHEQRGYHAGPSEQRAAIKNAVRASFDEALDTQTVLLARLSAAERLHQRWLDRSSLHVTP